MKQLAGAGLVRPLTTAQKAERTKLSADLQVFALTSTIAQYNLNSTAAVVSGSETRMDIPTAPTRLYPEMRGIDREPTCGCCDVKCLHCRNAHEPLPAMAKQSILAVYSRPGDGGKGL